MKVLIWVICLFMFSFVQTLCRSSGVILGGLPTALLAGLTFAAARALCRAWDKKHSKKGKEAEQEPQPADMPPLPLDAWNTPDLSVNQEPASTEDDEEKKSGY